MVNIPEIWSPYQIYDQNTRIMVNIPEIWPTYQKYGHHTRSINNIPERLTQFLSLSMISPKFSWLTSPLSNLFPKSSTRISGYSDLFGNLKIKVNWVTCTSCITVGSGEMFSVRLSLWDVASATGSLVLWCWRRAARAMISTIWSKYQRCGQHTKNMVTIPELWSTYQIYGQHTRNMVTIPEV